MKETDFNNLIEGVNEMLESIKEKEKNMYLKVAKTNMLNIIKEGSNVYDCDITFQTLGETMVDDNIIIFYLDNESEHTILRMVSCSEMNENIDDLTDSIINLIDNIEESIECINIIGIMLDGEFIEFEMQTTGKITR